MEWREAREDQQQGPALLARLVAHLGQQPQVLQRGVLGFVEQKRRAEPGRSQPAGQLQQPVPEVVLTRPQRPRGFGAGSWPGEPDGRRRLDVHLLHAPAAARPGRAAGRNSVQLFRQVRPNAGQAAMSGVELGDRGAEPAGLAQAVAEAEEKHCLPHPPHPAHHQGCRRAVGLDGITRALESAGGAFATGEVGREDARAGCVGVAGGDFGSDALFCAN